MIYFQYPLYTIRYYYLKGFYFIILIYSYDLERDRATYFTRLNDRGELSLHENYLYKTARYKSLRDLLAQRLPGWEVEIQTYTVGIRGSRDPDRWYAQLLRLEVTAARAERLMQGMVTQAITELIDLYRVRYATLQRLQHVQDSLSIPRERQWSSS